ncbi:DegV family protein [Streptococcus cuniculipharyngis]|uniref:DegV family protein n=1 Tax=Streptococcus cuniculipharyngis TaxID=1562651 RepID=A0A5C5SGE6_9STRE|nr:DegV family protein [Streptococcus cuniculipharyngis]TWS98981.1 DegV family protein [Streptococcus cuniculipharyngis]
MSRIKIVTDSSMTIAPDLIQELGITVVPLSVTIGDQVYSDSDLKEEGKFLALMKASKELPKTSQPPVGLFAETYESLKESGVEQMIAIHLTHALSGTSEASRQGAAIAGADVTVVDSGFTDQAMAFQVVAAAKMAQQGASLSEILAEIEKVRQATQLFIGVSTLENLTKGGRIGRVTGLLSSLLNIKVIMELKDHKLHTVVKGRGQKTFSKWLNELKTRLAARSIAEIGISYSGDGRFATELRDSLQDLVATEISLLETGSIIQTHTGEDAFAVMIRYD